MKDQDVDEAHGRSEGVYSKGGVPHHHHHHHHHHHFFNKSVDRTQR